MPIRWNPAQVSSAADMIEGFLNDSREPLESALTAAREALKIPNIPGYIEGDIRHIVNELEDTLGGGRYSTQGWYKRTIDRLREDIPADALKTAQAAEKLGATQSLI